MVNRINRQPIDTPVAEVTNTIWVIAPRQKQKEAMQRLEQALAEANYPMGGLAVHPFGSNEVEIEAVLTATSVDGVELDRLARELAGQDSIRQAFWSRRTSE